MDMDDTRLERLHDMLKEDCSWLEVSRLLVDKCAATGLPCNRDNCEPFRFAKFFNRPEVRNG